MVKGSQHQECRALQEIAHKSQCNCDKYHSRELEGAVPLDEKWLMKSIVITVQVIVKNLEKTSDSSKIVDVKIDWQQPSFGWPIFWKNEFEKFVSHYQSSSIFHETDHPGYLLVLKSILFANQFRIVKTEILLDSGI